MSVEKAVAGLPAPAAGGVEPRQQHLRNVAEGRDGIVPREGRGAANERGVPRAGLRRHEKRAVLRRRWNERVVGPITTSLRQGLTPETIALSLAWGAAAGLFPVVGTTTLLSLALAAALRLNLPAVQLANWAVYPLQLLLVLPLVRLGQSVSGTTASLAASPPAALVRPEALTGLQRVGASALNGVLGWLTILPVVVCLLYQASVPLLRALDARVRRPAGDGPESA